MKAKTKLTMLLGGLLLVLPWLSRAQQERGQGVRPSATEQRLALVIGNANYKEAALSNPVNDARDVAAALRACGFEVLSGEDRTQRQMKDLIREFGKKLQRGGVGLFYFAGHGVQVAGRNYLLPIGAEINVEVEVEYEALDAGFVLAQMEEARNRLNVVILDACRNNPYARGFRSQTRGLAGARNVPSGTLIAYATAADDVASDGGGRNGLFTGELLAQLKTPGLTLEQVFRRTRTSVRSKSGGKQVPYEYSSVEGEDFYFLPPAPAPVVRSDEETAWNFAKRSRSAAVVRLYLSDYPNSAHVAEARALLAELEKDERPALTPKIALPTKVKSAALSVLTFMTATVDENGEVTRFEGTPTQQYVEDLGGGVLLEMVPVKGVGNIKDFWIGKFEVTKEQWRAVMGNDPGHFKGNKLPVENVCLGESSCPKEFSVEEFIKRLNTKLGLRGASVYRLPKEAEWEHAARAGTKTEFAFGDTINTEVVNYNGNYPYGRAPKGFYREKTVDVGSLGVANAWGIFDMHGNVWEWCEDIHQNIYQSDGARRVIRGGGWNLDAIRCRSANRNIVAPGFRIDIVGFRLVRT